MIWILNSNLAANKQTKAWNLVAQVVKEHKINVMSYNEYFVIAMPQDNKEYGMSFFFPSTICTTSDLANLFLSSQAQPSSGHRASATIYVRSYAIGIGRASADDIDVTQNSTLYIWAR